MAKVNYSNIVVGDGRLFAAPGATQVSYGTFDWDITTNGENSQFYVGSTQNGVAMGWTPTMVDIEVDQFGDAARVIVQKVQVVIKTTLAEAVLENLALAWNYAYQETLAPLNISASTMSGLATAGIGANITQQLNLGIPSVYAKERFIRINGVAAGSTSENSLQYRTYRNTRAISYAASEFNMQRSDNQKYSVEFRILPDTQYTGKEYGYITDSALIPYTGFTI
jgi:hypothetical protein